MVNYLPVHVVDTLITFSAKLKYGDLSKYGIYRPKEGPLHLKNISGRSAVIDVGTVEKIKEGAIKVIPSDITRIKKKNVIFDNKMEKEFDAIVFATGYKSVANGWLKVYMIINYDKWKLTTFPLTIHILHFILLHFCVFFFKWTLFLILLLILN